MAAGFRKHLCVGVAALAVAAGAMAAHAAPAGSAGLTFRDSPPPPPLPAPPRAPAEAPNIIVVLIDDAGYGQFATFGGSVPSPSFDGLAKQGLRYTRFHTAGICSPTRAALLTGRNPHNAGFGIVEEESNGYDGYTGVIPDSTATVATVLHDNGYATAMFGKNHNTPTSEGGPAGPFNHWPTGMGFDYFYGFNGWGNDQWHPTLFEGTAPVPPSANPEYTLNTDLADHAISWMRKVQSVSPDKPYFLYFATGGTHAPHQVPESWTAHFKGQFDEGWDVYREKAFERQKALGVIPKDAVLTPRPDGIPAWDSLSPEQKRIDAREMEVFAGFSAQTEYEIGRVIKAAQAQPNGRDTMIICILGDNGASAEGGLGGTISELAQGNGLGKAAAVTEAELPKLGGPEYENHMSYGWAWAVDAPFRYYKQVVSHLGAIRNPMIVWWPSHVHDPGAVRSQFLDVTDIAPTLLAAAHLKMPTSVHGVAQKPLDGVSALATIEDPKAPEVRSTQYFEVFGNRGIYDHGWFASAKLADPWVFDRANLDPFKVRWELYDLDHDFTQAHDLASQNPEKLKQLEDLWWAEAARNNVLPIDWRVDRPTAPMGSARRSQQTHFVFYPGTFDVPEAIAPVVRNRSWRVAADGAFTPSDKGMLITQGGTGGGWAFYLRDGTPVFDYNLNGVRRFRVVGQQAIPAGTRRLEMRFAYDDPTGAKRGLGGTVTFLADGRTMGSGRIEQTLPNMFSINEGLDVGADYGAPVSDYPFPAPFTGKLDSVTLDLG